jgi:hypothetical protein
MSYLGNSPGVSSQRNTTTITATAGQTTFTTTSGYQLGYIDVFLNGTKLVSGDDFTASNGTSITLALAANVGDAVELVSYTPRGLSDGYTKPEADAKYLQLNTSHSGDVTGAYNALTLANSGVSAGSYGTASAIPAITVDAKGRITAISTNAVSIPSGSISVTGGDITMSGNTGTAITNAIIANNAVTTAKIADGAVTSAKLDTNIAISGTLTVGGSQLGSSGLSVNGTTGNDDSQIAIKKPNQSTFSLLAWDGSIFIGYNNYFSNGTWVHSAPTGVNVQSLLVIGGDGVYTYASSNSGSSWNLASGVKLWDLDGTWRAPLNSGAATINGNLTLTGELRGPSTLIIDPAAIGDDTGTVRVRGNLQVDGTTTTVNSTTLEVADLNITLAKNAINAGAADGAGITVAGASATLTYAAGTDSWSFNKNLGIGTSSPGVKLDVNGAMRSNSITISNTASNSILTMNPGTALYSIIAMTGTSNNAALGLDILAGQGNAWFSADTHYFRNAAQTTNYVVINSTGLGVGMSPTNKLTIKPSTTSSAVFDVLTGSTNADSIRLNVGGTVNTWLELRGYLGIKLYSDQTNVLTVNSSGHTLPGTDNSYDLGSFTARWRNIYTADMHFSNEGSQNSVDGTWGNWTLQEGEESIYMLNNRTGRKYKIVLEEV